MHSRIGHVEQEWFIGVPLDEVELLLDRRRGGQLRFRAIPTARWRNGRRSGLKTHGPHGHTGSSPVGATTWNYRRIRYSETTAENRPRIILRIEFCRERVGRFRVPHRFSRSIRLPRITRSEPVQNGCFRPRGDRQGAPHREHARRSAHGSPLVVVRTSRRSEAVCPLLGVSHVLQ